MASTLLTEHHGTTLLVRLHNPPTDLLTGQSFAELGELGRKLAKDRTTRAVVITGPRPGVFAPHFDLAEILSGGEELGLPTPYPLARPAYAAVAGAVRLPGADRVLRGTPLNGLVTLAATHAALARFARLPQVVIAAIGGDALGGGCEVALACDLRLMADGDHLIGLPEVSAGIPPGAGGSVRLAQAVGASRAAAMMLTAQPLTPAAAQAAGLVHEVVPEAELLDRSLAVAERVAAWNPSAVRAVKRTVAASHRAGRRALRIEAGGFIAAASAAPALDRLREFVDASDEAAGVTPWRDRRWLGVAGRSGR